jgi:hypothetical protein
MLIYSESHYVANNGNGYSLDERDAICSNCHNAIDRQEKYRGVDKSFGFSESEKKAWRYCPYCGTELYPAKR